jgi:hypothetical protein
MNDVDMLVRDTLQDRADVAPAGTGLLTLVHSRSRQLRRRRRLAAAGAGAAAVVLVVAVAPAVLNLDRDGGPARTGAPAASGSPTRGAGPSSEPGSEPSAGPTPVRAVLGRPDLRLPEFPFTPKPDAVAGLGPARVMVDGGPYLMHAPLTDNGPSLEAHTGTAEPPFPAAEAGVTVTSGQTRVRGRDATLRRVTSDGYVERTLQWQESPGVWLWVRSSTVDPAGLVAYAEGLRAGPMPVEAPFTFDLLPQGLTPDVVGPSVMVFRLPGQPAGGTFLGKLAILLNAESGSDTSMWLLRVDGRPATVRQQDGERSFAMLMPDGSALVIQVPPWLVISDEDLVRLAGGITVSGTARPGQG